MSDRRRLRPLNAVTGLLLAVWVAGCGSAGSSTSGSASPVARAGTPTPPKLTLPPIQTIALKGFAASFVVPSTHGLVLLGTPAGGPNDNGLPRTLYYSSYDDETHSVRSLAVATPASDGTQRQITPAAASGDWVAYLESDTMQGHKALSVVDVLTGERHLVAADGEGSASLDFLSNGPVVMDESDLVYAASSAQGNGLFDYHLASGTAQLLSGVAGNPVAVSNGTLWYTQAASLDGGPLSTWWVSLSHPVPTLLSSTSGYDYAVNDRYIVWDQDVIENGVHTGERTLTLFDRTNSKQMVKPLASCGSPSLASDRPYLICQNGVDYRLVQVPTGASASLGITGPGTARFVGDRAYFLANSSAEPIQIDYIDLPIS